MLKRFALWLVRKEVARTTLDYEGRLRYAQFHKDAAVAQRMSIVKELRGFEARIHGGKRLTSRMGHLKLRRKLIENRAASRA